MCEMCGCGAGKGRKRLVNSDAIAPTLGAIPVRIVLASAQGALRERQSRIGVERPPLQRTPGLR